MRLRVRDTMALTMPPARYMANIHFPAQTAPLTRPPASATMAEARPWRPRKRWASSGSRKGSALGSSLPQPAGQRSASLPPSRTPSRSISARTSDGSERWYILSFPRGSSTASWNLCAAVQSAPRSSVTCAIVSEAKTPTSQSMSCSFMLRQGTKTLKRKRQLKVPIPSDARLWMSVLCSTCSPLSSVTLPTTWTDGTVSSIVLMSVTCQTTTRSWYSSGSEAGNSMYGKSEQS
mmetsp:Transcript_72228/g.200333  ORF Transcript_72228/g.200333 Transcript_72228/m.200333 type:complete len:234 (+) Transcript_72228:179-880(+)